MTALSKLYESRIQLQSTWKDSKGKDPDILGRWSPLWKSNCSRWSSRKIVGRVVREPAVESRVGVFLLRAEYRHRSIMPNLTKTCAPCATYVYLPLNDMDAFRRIFVSRSGRSLPTWHLLPAALVTYPATGLQIVPRVRSRRKVRRGRWARWDSVPTVIHFVHVWSCVSCRRKRIAVPKGQALFFTAKPGHDYNEPIPRIPESPHCISSIVSFPTVFDDFLPELNTSYS